MIVTQMHREPVPQRVTLDPGEGNKYLIDRLLYPSGTARIGAIFIIFLLLAAGGVFVYLTGGTEFVYAHAMYLPILVGSFTFGWQGGLLTALLAAAILGPYMPLEVASHTPQAAVNWLYRLVFFVLVGSVSGSLVTLVYHRLQRIKQVARELSITQERTLRTFGSSVSIRDEHTGGHCDRVADNAVRVGKGLGLSGSTLRELYWAGLLHDLGKISVPEHILLNPSRLTESEYARIQEHASMGSDMLLAVSETFAPVAAGVRSHHERWDGKGYPDKLAGDDIPLSGRILAVVDVFEALTSDRPYHEPMSAHDALALLRTESGAQFDPTVVRVFETLYLAGEIRMVHREGAARQVQLVPEPIGSSA